MSALKEPRYLYEIIYRVQRQNDHLVRRIPMLMWETESMEVEATDSTLSSVITNKVRGKFEITGARRIRRLS